MAKEPWYESDNPDRVGGALFVRWALVVGVILLIGTLISLGTWAFSVATSDIKGQGDATKIVNAGGNRLAQQAYFEQTYQDIKAADRKLDLLASDKKDKVDGADIRYTGGVTYCLTLVGDYNAAASKQVAEKFRSANLPEQINSLDSETDCKENNA